MTASCMPLKKPEPTHFPDPEFTEDIIDTFWTIQIPIDGRVGHWTMDFDTAFAIAVKAVTKPLMN